MQVWGYSVFSSDEGDALDPAMSEFAFYIRMILDQLARITIAIRKAGNKYRFDRIDKDLKTENFEEFRSHLTSVILSRFFDPVSESLNVMEKIRRASEYDRAKSSATTACESKHPPSESYRGHDKIKKHKAGATQRRSTIKSDGKQFTAA